MDWCKFWLLFNEIRLDSAKGNYVRGKWETLQRMLEVEELRQDNIGRN